MMQKITPTFLILICLLFVVTLISLLLMGFSSSPPLPTKPLQKSLTLNMFHTRKATSNFKDDLIPVKGVITVIGDGSSLYRAIGLSYRYEMDETLYLPLGSKDKIEAWIPPETRALVLKIRKFKERDRISDEADYNIFVLTESSKLLSATDLSTKGSVTQDIWLSLPLGSYRLRAGECIRLFIKEKDTDQGVMIPIKAKGSDETERKK